MSNRIIFFTKYGRLGASSRLRSFQYIPFFEKQGYTCIVKNLFSDDYLVALYNKKPVTSYVFKAYIKRFFQLLAIKKRDIIIVEKEFFPYFPALAEKLFELRSQKYYADYDDAIFHNYDSSKNFLIKFFLKHKIEYVMKCSHYVVAGNAYLAERAKLAGAKNICIIPTVIDIEKYSVKNYTENTNKKIVIGWIGTPMTAKYIRQLTPIFERLKKHYIIQLKLVGIKKSIGLTEIEDLIDWSEETEVNVIKSFDIGIMPLDNTKWELGKCGYKLIQYMACGLPVIASSIGVNKTIVTHEKNGFLVSSDAGWTEAFNKLLSNDLLRQQMGMQGRRTIENNYTIQTQFKNWLEILNS